MVDNILTYLPPLNLLILFCALNVVRFENQRWIRARQAGMRGRNWVGGFFVDLIGFSSMIFYYMFLISYGLDNEIWSAVLLVIVASMAGLLASTIFTSLFGGDNPIVWAISTVAIIPLQILLFSEVTWFGWFA